MSSKHSMRLCDAEEMTGQGSGEQPGLGDLSANAHGILSASPDRQDGQAAGPGEEEIAEFSRDTCHRLPPGGEAAGPQSFSAFSLEICSEARGLLSLEGGGHGRETAF